MVPTLILVHIVWKSVIVFVKDPMMRKIEQPFSSVINIPGECLNYYVFKITWVEINIYLLT